MYVTTQKKTIIKKTYIRAADKRPVLTDTLVESYE